ncbi:glycosyltransferase involved in cell wall biosynthesis [Williamsia limnetica]|uniref:Glycosyltransferase involved in cell wall biosynthesis n=1 Tax=Williamsia limnetica TaxID=882452 RepID=A0A318RS21_WILLI|nr:glycosyltransferase family 4 protein [Williamsia limnetica]PYE20218.1 glycosyltransferase involved in cell wall biosynthesis [Williamsia limnetica]
MTRPIVLVEFSPSGGLFQFAVQLGQALARRGERVILLTGPNPEFTSSQPGFTIKSSLPTWHPADTEVLSKPLRLARRGLRAGQLMVAWLVLAAVLLRIRPRAVLWSHWRFTFEPMFVVLITHLVRKSTFGIVAHEPLPRSDARDTSTPKSGRLVDAAFAAAWRRMDVAFVLGPRTREVVLEHFEPGGEVVVIPHGDEGLLVTNDDAVAVSDTGPVALFFGTWTTYKGIDVLLDAFALVRRQLPAAELVLAGAVGADVDHASLLRRAAEIGNVDARAGYVAHTDVAGIVQSARVVVTPYVRASQSGVAHLAFTFGRPVIASAVGDLPDVVRDGETGLLVPAGDAAALAAAMVTLLTDPDLAERLGCTGRSFLTESWSVAADRIVLSLEGAS